MKPTKGGYNFMPFDPKRLEAVPEPPVIELRRATYFKWGRTGVEVQVPGAKPFYLSPSDARGLAQVISDLADLVDADQRRFAGRGVSRIVHLMVVNGAIVETPDGGDIPCGSEMNAWATDLTSLGGTYEIHPAMGERPSMDRVSEARRTVLAIAPTREEAELILLGR